MVKTSPATGNSDGAAKKRRAEGVFKDTALSPIPRKRRGRRGGRRRRRRAVTGTRFYLVIADESLDIYNAGQRVRDYTRRRIPIHCICTGRQAAMDTCRQLLNQELRALRNRGVDCWALENGDLEGLYARIPGSVGWVGIGTNDRNLRRAKWTWVEYEANKINTYVAMDEQTWTPDATRAAASPVHRRRSPSPRRSRSPSPRRSRSPSPRRMRKQSRSPSPRRRRKESPRRSRTPSPDRSDSSSSDSE